MLNFQTDFRLFIFFSRGNEPARPRQGAGAQLKLEHDHEQRLQQQQSAYNRRSRSAPCPRTDAAGRRRFPVRVSRRDSQPRRAAPDGCLSPERGQGASASRERGRVVHLVSTRRHQSAHLGVTRGGSRAATDRGGAAEDVDRDDDDERQQGVRPSWCALGRIWASAHPWKAVPVVVHPRPPKAVVRSSLI